MLMFPLTPECDPRPHALCLHREWRWPLYAVEGENTPRWNEKGGHKGDTKPQPLFFSPSFLL